MEMKLQVPVTQRDNKTLLGKVCKEMLLKFCKSLAFPTLLHGSKCLTLKQQQNKWPDAAKMQSLRVVAGYRLIKSVKR